jgi:glycosyltransferase involved in cell wall biosynthesis
MKLAISVVIPVYDGERYLAEAIESVVRQRPAPAEVIVVDDGSTDGSAAVAASFGGAVRYVRQAHAGIGAARNRGVAEARGTHLAWVDADDLWEEGRLEPQLRLLAGPPEVDLVFGGAVSFFSPDLSADERRRLHCPTGVQPAISLGTSLARLDRFRTVGPFSEDLGSGELIDWMLRARESGLREAMLDAIVLRRRIHGANHGIVRRDAASGYLRVAREALERRREGPRS